MIARNLFNTLFLISILMPIALTNLQIVMSFINPFFEISYTSITYPICFLTILVSFFLKFPNNHFSIYTKYAFFILFFTFLCFVISFLFNFNYYGVSFSFKAFIGLSFFIYSYLFFVFYQTSDKKILKTIDSAFLIFFLLNFVAVILQIYLSLTNQNIINILWLNPNLNTVLLPRFFGIDFTFRPFGLYTSAGFSAIFTLTFLIYVHSNVSPTLRRYKKILIFMALFIIIFSITRKIWLSTIFFYALFLPDILKVNSASRLLMYTFALLILLTASSIGSYDTGILNTNSGLERLNNWGYALYELIVNRSIIFGTLELQSEGYLASRVNLIDNALISQLYYIGLFGFSLTFSLCYLYYVSAKQLKIIFKKNKFNIRKVQFLNYYLLVSLPLIVTANFFPTYDGAFLIGLFFTLLFCHIVNKTSDRDSYINE